MASSLCPGLFLTHCLLLLLSPGAQDEFRHFASLQALLDPCSLPLSPTTRPPQPQAGPLGVLTVLLVGGQDFAPELVLACKERSEA